MEHARVETRPGSPYWYAIFEHDGHRERRSLKVKIAGQPPDASTGNDGDAAYYRSRDKAMQLAASLSANTQEEANSRRLAKVAFKITTNRNLNSLPIGELPQFWRKHVLQSANPNRRHVQVVDLWFKRLCSYLRKANPKVRFVGHISFTDAEGFYRHWTKTIGLSSKTCRDGLYLLRQTFEVLVAHDMAPNNVFKAVRAEPVVTTSKRPYSDAEIRLILAVVRDDDDWRVLVKLLLLCALRLGDACQITWKVMFSDVDGIGIQSKTKGRFIAPLYQPLAKELQQRYKAMRSPPLETYVFPTLAERYKKDSGTVSQAFMRILKQAGFSENPASMLAVRVKPTRGKRCINIRGAHAFRTTLATRAYVAGVPVEIIRRLTGHTSTALEKHYLQPEAEDIKKMISDKLPNLLQLAATGSANNQPGKRRRIKRK